jgi:hypothetical protein
MNLVPLTLLAAHAARANVRTYLRPVLRTTRAKNLWGAKTPFISWDHQDLRAKQSADAPRGSRRKTQRLTLGSL